MAKRYFEKMTPTNAILYLREKAEGHHETAEAYDAIIAVLEEQKETIKKLKAKIKDTEFDREFFGVIKEEQEERNNAEQE